MTVGNDCKTAEHENPMAGRQFSGHVCGGNGIPHILIAFNLIGNPQGIRHGAHASWEPGFRVVGDLLLTYRKGLTKEAANSSVVQRSAC